MQNEESAEDPRDEHRSRVGRREELRADGHAARNLAIEIMHTTLDEARGIVGEGDKPYRRERIIANAQWAYLDDDSSEPGSIPWCVSVLDQDLDEIRTRLRAEWQDARILRLTRKPLRREYDPDPIGRAIMVLVRAVTEAGLAAMGMLGELAECIGVLGTSRALCRNKFVKDHGRRRFCDECRVVAQNRSHHAQPADAGEGERETPRASVPVRTVERAKPGQIVPRALIEKITRPMAVEVVPALGELASDLDDLIEKSKARLDDVKTQRETLAEEERRLTDLVAGLELLAKGSVVATERRRSAREGGGGRF